MSRLATSLALTLSLSACASPPPREAGAPVSSAPAPPPPPVNAPPFARATAAEAGLDPAALEAFRRRGEETRSDALILLRDGKLVLDERYGHDEGRIETMSVSKSIVALVIGRLVDTGRLASIDEPVSRFYPEWQAGKKGLVTVRHLLEQTSGIKSNPTTEEIYASPDFVRLALEADLVSEPGATFFYNNKAVNLLAGIAQIASGRRLDTLAREELFDPLGIDDVEWVLDKSGNPHAMSGIRLHPLDLAKLGQMMLDGGRWKGRPIVSEAWIRQMTSPSPKNDRYGLLTWLDYPHGGPTNERRPFAFRMDGWLGQYVVVVPARRLVAVRMRRNRDGEGAKEEYGFRDFVKSVSALARGGS